ncbi:MAG: type II toxin-antitoxin system ParD family antitoxin [Proteobacteria bacterium]|nr:type II toxin-antitoxin system ParD family antitoxin [Pseudomonadota bacterium]MBS0571690.1 type II toxin-antitoxin system ParD family antitoxin [Pseudomonadota bacterium]
MPTRNVVITDHQSAFIDEMVASGRYQNASEVLRAGLRLIEREEEEWAEVRAGVLEGLEQVRRGELVEGDGLDALRQIIDEIAGRK